MEVFNKFYTTVSNTVSQLSGVLPGNPVTREYEVTEFIATAGPGLLWKVYKGYKKSTKQEAAIFVFEKKQLDHVLFPKVDREYALKLFKNAVYSLTKLRHPQILTVQHGLEESRDSLAFATEPVFASLANILKNEEGLSHLNNYNLYEVEIKYGLLQITEGLAFLHNDVKLLHKNICPESIIINKQGAWKIFGLDYCVLNTSPPGTDPYWPFVEYSELSHRLTQPPLDYYAPENVVSLSHSPASDMFSLAMLIYTIYSPNHETLGNFQHDLQRFKKFIPELRSNLIANRLTCIPNKLKEHVKLMLNVTPELRPDPHQFLKLSFFDDIGVKALNYLDSMFQWDNLQKSQFYKGLPQIMQKMPHRICLNRILPCLVKEFINPPMVPFVLPNVLMIAGNSTQEEFIKHILPVLKPVMMIQDPIQILLIFMQNMEMLLKLTPGEDIKTDVLPMLYRALDADAQQIQELCLSVLPTFASLIDYPSMKNALLPRIKRLCFTTNYLSVRVNCLLCIGKLLEHLDKWLVLDEIIPFLPQITSREPAVLMGILGIYKLAYGHKKLGITKEILATKVLPFLITLCVENGLTVNQFNAIISVVKQMISTVETEHKAKLVELNAINNESKNLPVSLQTTNLIPVPAQPSETDSMFVGLDLEQFTQTKPQIEKQEAAVPSIKQDCKSLSIEEKQRLAVQQETSRRYSQQAQLYTPLDATKAINNSHKPLDLTDKLLSSNLNQLSNKPVASNSMSNFQPAVNAGIQPMPLNSMSNNTQNYSKAFNQPMGSDKPVPSANQHQVNWNVNTTGNFNNKWANKQNNQTQIKQDWSAFESLLPDQTKETSNNNVKLDNTEMMDLLS